MGAKCCTDRKEPGGGGGERPSKVGIGDKPDRKSVRQSVHANNAYGPSRGISISYQGKGEDSTKFDQAFEASDLKAFVELLSSNEEIEPFEEKMHPWAEDPKTIGSLAGTQLAILASMAEKENKTVKDDIRQAGAIPKLVEFLKSGKNDRVQTAVVALSFLTTDNVDNAQALYKAGGMELYAKLLDCDIAGMRAAVSTTLRDMMIENMEARLKFVELGGTKGLIQQLNAPHDPSLNHADVQLEAVLNVQDFLEDENGDVIPEIAREVVRCGAKEELTKLLKSDDDEVKGSVEEVLAVLEGY